MVNIKIKAEDINSDEYKDALELKQIFENGLNDNHYGNVLIVPNVTLFGQDTKDVDLIVLGRLNNFKKKLKTKLKSKNGLDDNLETRNINIFDFCFVIEVKRHNPEKVEIRGQNLVVYYRNKKSDATTQSERQKYALKSYLEDRLNFSPFICNFIWFKNISRDELLNLVSSSESENLKYTHNYLHSDFSLSWLFQLACIQNIPYCSNDRNNFYSFHRQDVNKIPLIENIFDLFQKVKKGSGKLTRSKIEKITKTLLKDQEYAKGIGEKLIIVSGRAGTGKTIKLLSIAYDLAEKQDMRCLILTYNHSLVGDIKRLVALSNMPSHVSGKTVNIKTLHKYFYDLLDGFQLLEPNKNFIFNYDNYIDTLNQYIEEKTISNSDISDLMKENYDELNWDYFLIDEGQDWSENEKRLIFNIVGRNNVIVADGVDQLIRTRTNCDWKYRLSKDEFRNTYEKKSLRQKQNLVTFINKLSNKVNVNWELEPTKEHLGGRVIISTKQYDKELHNEEYEYCLENENKAYEMMFLVPPKLVKRMQDENYNENYISEFSLKNEFEEMKIKIWDGTNKKNRTEYATDLDQHRVFQYESCRGLEGWTVVCLEFDEFLKYKIETFKEDDSREQTSLMSFDEKRDEFVYLWSLIPLTRAIDTLIITLNDPNSKIGKILRELYEENQDFIDWLE